MPLKGIAVIADDFTGANDIGVQFALAGHKVNVLFDFSPINSETASADSISIYCTNSRDLTEGDAKNCLAKVLEHVKADTVLLKKIDSTMRGNIGAEIAEILNSTERKMAIVAPASPSLGRTTENGLCLVNGLPLIDTEFASDPKSPIRSSQISAIISNQYSQKIVELTKDKLIPGALSSQLINLQKQGIKVVVIDADSLSDLKNITDTVQTLPFSTVLVGSSDMGKILVKSTHDAHPVFTQMLAIIGSMSEITQQQIELIQKRDDVCIIDFDISALFARGRISLVKELSQDIKKSLSAGLHTVVRSCQDSRQRYEVDQLAMHHQVSKQHIGNEIKAFLGEVTRIAISDNAPSCLYLSGGDIAMAIAQSLGVQGFSIKGQVENCVPWGEFSNNAYQGMVVMTKAGAFGDKTTLQQILKITEEYKHE